jgi:hypothetical protein
MDSVRTAYLLQHIHIWVKHSSPSKLNAELRTQLQLSTAGHTRDRAAAWA